MPHWHARVQADNVDEVGDGNLRAIVSLLARGKTGWKPAVRPPGWAESSLQLRPCDSILGSHLPGGLQRASHSGSDDIGRRLGVE